ncbi:MAG: DUF4359 domain-containing protein, partial [Bacteroidales bacterium]
MASNKKFPLFESMGVIVFAILVVLAFTNPDMEDFKKFFKQEMVSEVNSDSPWVETLADLLEKPLWSFLEPYTDRDNYLLFSIYKFELEEEKIVYLGIWDRFYR